MNTISSVVEDLTQLAELDNLRRGLDARSSRFRTWEALANQIRERLPTAVLKHYDVRLSKGKRGAAWISNGTCGGCHLSLPSGQLADLRRDQPTLHVCGYCGIFLLPESRPENVGVAPPPQAGLAKPVSGKLKRKGSGQA